MPDTSSSCTCQFHIYLRTCKNTEGFWRWISWRSPCILHTQGRCSASPRICLRRPRRHLYSWSPSPSTWTASCLLVLGTSSPAVPGVDEDWRKMIWWPRYWEWLENLDRTEEVDNILDADNKHPGTVCQYWVESALSEVGVGADGDHSASLMNKGLGAEYETVQTNVRKTFYHLYVPILLDFGYLSRMIWMEVPAWWQMDGSDWLLIWINAADWRKGQNNLIQKNNTGHGRNFLE